MKWVLGIMLVLAGLAMGVFMGPVWMQKFNAGKNEVRDPIELESVSVELPGSILLTADLACEVSIDGGATFLLEEGQTKKVNVSLGQHLIRAVSNDQLVRVEEILFVESPAQKICKLSLRSIKEPRKTQINAEQKRPQEKRREEENSRNAKEARENLEKKLGLEFVFIEAGTFMMGDTDTTPHLVTLTKSFYMGKYEVTQAQWRAMMQTNPSNFSECDPCPVEHVSWKDVQEFIRRLNGVVGSSVYGLPTEAEWEYACRAGSTTAFYFGDDEKQMNTYAWFTGNSEGKTHPVGQKQPNAWGLYDMHGNVREWCQDWDGTYPAYPVTDPKGASDGSYRVYRGGSWYYYARYSRSASRGSNSPGYRDGDLGFRLMAYP